MNGNEKRRAVIDDSGKTLVELIVKIRKGWIMSEKRLLSRNRTKLTDRKIGIRKGSII